MARNRDALPAPETGEDVAILLLRHSLRSTITAAGEALGLLVIVLGALLSSGIDRSRLAVWAGAVVLNLVLYSIVLHGVSRHLEAGARAARLRSALTVVQVMAGVCWGAGTFVDVSGDERAAALLATAILMIASGNLIYSASTPGPFLAMHLPLCGLGVAGLMTGGHVTLGLMVAFTGVSALPLRKELHQTVLRAIETARRNERLAQEVLDQQRELERINLGLIEANVELSHRATRDPLTQLANRDVFTEHLESGLARWGGPHSMAEVGVIYFDIDKFKSVNDTLGHAAGDAVLQEVAIRVAAVLPEGDLLARLGGDEFVVTVAGVHGEAARVAHDIHATFSMPFDLDGVTHRFSASIGVATARPGCSPAELIAWADTALYRAKAAGRNQVAVWTGPAEGTPDPAGPAPRPASLRR